MKKCDKCGNLVDKTISVDSDDFVPFNDNFYLEVAIGNLYRKVCRECCRGAKVIIIDNSQLVSVHA
jgi:hypothetical protein